MSSSTPMNGTALTRKGEGLGVRAVDPAAWQSRKDHEVHGHSKSGERKLFPEPSLDHADFLIPRTVSCDMQPANALVIAGGWKCSVPRRHGYCGKLRPAHRHGCWVLDSRGTRCQIDFRKTVIETARRRVSNCTRMPAKRCLKTRRSCETDRTNHGNPTSMKAKKRATSA